MINFKFKSIMITLIFFLFGIIFIFPIFGFAQELSFESKYYIEHVLKLLIEGQNLSLQKQQLDKEIIAKQIEITNAMKETIQKLDSEGLYLEEMAIYLRQRPENLKAFIKKQGIELSEKK